MNCFGYHLYVMFVLVSLNSNMRLFASKTLNKQLLKGESGVLNIP